MDRSAIERLVRAALAEQNGNGHPLTPYPSPPSTGERESGPNARHFLCGALLQACAPSSFQRTKPSLASYSASPSLS